MKSSTFELGVIHYNCRIENLSLFLSFRLFSYYYSGFLNVNILNFISFITRWRDSYRLFYNQKCFISQRFVVKQNQEHYAWRIFQQQTSSLYVSLFYFCHLKAKPSFILPGVTTPNISVIEVSNDRYY